MSKKITILKPAAASIKLKHKDKLNLMSVQLGPPLKTTPTPQTSSLTSQLTHVPPPPPYTPMRTGKHKSSYTRRQISNIFSIVLTTLFCLGRQRVNQVVRHPLKLFFFGFLMTIINTHSLVVTGYANFL